MAHSDPFGVLGLPQDADVEMARRAWRSLAREFHPDSGGSHEKMTRLNDALRDVMISIESRQSAKSPSTRTGAVSARLIRDVSSFTVNVLPVVCWRALEVVAAEFGPMIHEEEPYLLEFLLHDSTLEAVTEGWCRCELVPEAGATMIHLTVGSHADGLVPHVVEVRDALIHSLNAIDWPME